MEDEVVFSIDISDRISGLVNDDELKRKILKLWAARIRTFLFSRYRQFSQGGGTWAPLKRPRKTRPARIRRGNSEQASIKAHFDKQAILVNTGTLRNALTPTMLHPGSLEEFTINSDTAMVSIGFGGSGAHPGKGRPVTIAELAAIHHFGVPAKNIPARPIIVEPDQKTENALVRIAQNAINNYGGE